MEGETKGPFRGGQSPDRRSLGTPSVGEVLAAEHRILHSHHDHDYHLPLVRVQSAEPICASTHGLALLYIQQTLI